MGIYFKKGHNILLLYDAGQFYVKKKQESGGRIKICEIFLR